MPHMCLRNQIQHHGALSLKELHPGGTYMYHFCRSLVVNGNMAEVHEYDKCPVVFLRVQEDGQLVVRNSVGAEFRLSLYMVGLAPDSLGAYICNGHLGRV